MTFSLLLRMLALAAALVSSGCDTILEVDYPGRIPAAQLDDPAYAAVWAHSAVSDFECAYNNYTGGAAVHGDEFETSNGNVPLTYWGERNITADIDDYAIGLCEAGASNFGMHTVLHTARVQARDAFERLSQWSDAEVAGRLGLMATVKAYGAYTYALFGETFCTVSYDGGSAVAPDSSLALAQAAFVEAIALAQQAGNADIANLARVGLARTQLDRKQYAAAAATAVLVPPAFVRNASRGNETPRRYNKLFSIATQSGAFTVDTSYRNTGDPRLPVENANRNSALSTVPLWIQTKYTSLGAPIRLASGREAALIRAEALAAQGQIQEALALINPRRDSVGLAPRSAATAAEAVAHVLAERRIELAFEGGHRLNDILRHQLPWKGAFGSTRETNMWTGRRYGQTTCFPLPLKEQTGA